MLRARATGYRACKGTRKQRACSVLLGTASARGRGGPEHAWCQCYWVQRVQRDEEAQSMLCASATGYSANKGTRKRRACLLLVPLGTAPARGRGSAERAPRQCHWVQRLQGDEEAQSMLHATGYSACNGTRRRRACSVPVPLGTALARGQGSTEHARCHWVQRVQRDEEAQSMLGATGYSACNGTRNRRACSMPLGTVRARGRGSAERALCQCHWVQHLQRYKEAHSMLGATGYSACKGTRKRRACSVPVPQGTAPARGRGRAEHARCQWVQRVQRDEEAQSVLRASATGYSASKGTRKHRACSVPVGTTRATGRGSAERAPCQ
ncbi:hypothetical protein NDU88_001092 [Pleurodeles waltl]|uniref:Uncharacterized protein n=1 Tax=Pleurodeles waltl TaxID=8319 RepID=A0AAV7M026_PLEWA|nr:hypothetical protein NDU88_001092 [Pleurodeles waltl]